MRRINEAGLSLIKSFEATRLLAYQDQKGIWSIGTGHVGPEVQPGLEITPAEADELLQADLSRSEKAVDRFVDVPLTDNQFAAVVCFVFNVGEGNFAKSTLLRCLNEGDFSGAATQFMRWVYAGQEISEGLVRRRKAEQKLFLTS